MWGFSSKAPAKQNYTKLENLDNRECRGKKRRKFISFQSILYWGLGAWLLIFDNVRDVYLHTDLLMLLLILHDIWEAVMDIYEEILVYPVV